MEEMMHKNKSVLIFLLLIIMFFISCYDYAYIKDSTYTLNLKDKKKGEKVSYRELIDKYSVRTPSYVYYRRSFHAVRVRRWHGPRYGYYYVYNHTPVYTGSNYQSYREYRGKVLMAFDSEDKPIALYFFHELENGKTVKLPDVELREGVYTFKIVEANYTLRKGKMFFKLKSALIYDETEQFQLNEDEVVSLKINENENGIEINVVEGK